MTEQAMIEAMLKRFKIPTSITPLSTGSCIKLAFNFDHYVGGFTRKVGTPNILITFNETGQATGLNWNLSLLG